MGGLLLFSVQTLPPISLLNSGWPHRAKRLASPELNPPVNSDSDLDLMPKEDPEETSAQDPEVLSWGHPGLDTTPAPSWPGLQSLLQQLPPQDSDVGLPLPSFPLSCFPLFTYCGKK